MCVMILLLLMYELKQFLSSPACSFYAMGQATPANGMTTPQTGTSKQQPTASPVSSTPASQTGKDYDFSSLTQGMFAKH